ncbi:MAG: hypothetical protein ABI658_32600 [Acidimicrobiales bacterium]
MKLSCPVLAIAALCIVVTACGTTEPSAPAGGAQVATTGAPAAKTCARWLRDDAVAPDLAAAVAALRAKLDRDFPTMNVSVGTDHASPPRIRLHVTDRRDQIEAAARSVLDPMMASRLVVELVRDDPQSSNEQVFTQVVEFLTTGPVPMTGMGISVGLEIVIELNSETHACELADALAQRFPADPVFVKVWPPASLAEEGKSFFGTWFLSDPAVSHDDRLRLDLSRDGTFQMRDNCNYKTGRWAIENNAADTISFRDAAITAIACPTRPDTLGMPRRAQINAVAELVVEQINQRLLTYTR